MKSEWRVAAIPTGDRCFYIAYRLVDASKADTPINREYCGGFNDSNWEVKKFVKGLNAKKVKESQ